MGFRSYFVRVGGRLSFRFNSSSSSRNCQNVMSLIAGLVWLIFRGWKVVGIGRPSPEQRTSANAVGHEFERRCVKEVKNQLFVLHVHLDPSLRRGNESIHIGLVLIT